MSLSARPAAWWDEAACRGTDWSLWRPPTQSKRDGAYVHRVSRNELLNEQKAAAICATCPVFAACRADADKVPDPSFRAGYPARDRHKQNRGRW